MTRIILLFSIYISHISILLIVPRRKEPTDVDGYLWTIYEKHKQWEPTDLVGEIGGLRVPPTQDKNDL